MRISDWSSDVCSSDLTKFWKGLPADIRTVLAKSMDEATAYGNKLAYDINEGDKKKIMASGKSEIITLTKQQQDAWRKAMAPVYKQLEPDVGQDLINAALASNKPSCA